MKNKWFLYTVIAATLLTLTQTLHAQSSKDYAVLVTADINESAPSITLNWETDNYGTQYRIFRKNAGTTGWGSSLATLGGSDTTWTDNNVSVGTAYEYFVEELGGGGFKGFGYIQSGIAIDLKESEGNVLLIIESSLQDSMQAELDMLKMDLTLAGWYVIDRYVAASDSVSKVKALIDQVAATEELEAIYLFGHVPVPYSGQFCNLKYIQWPPDGHVEGQGDHCGAWAADVYYAVPEGNWTDKDSTINGAKRDANKNYAGDGKFDQHIIPGEVKYQLGRVDLSSMPAFAKTEVELLKQYINKAHNFRNNQDYVYQKSLIDENFGASAGAFASTAWRDFTSALGSSNVKVSDYFTILKDNNYLLAYGAGPGYWDKAGGIGNTTDFTTKNAAIFNYLFGSFFGDWDVSDNFLRAPLASDTGGLTNAWVGRPWWNTFPMALGETIGYCTRSSQNNTTQYGNYYGLNICRNFTHVSLMGDPTLKMFVVSPASDLSLTPAVDRKSVLLEWTASPDNDVIGYHIYYSTNEYGPYGRLNSSLVTTTSFNHTWPHAGTNHYYVRAVKLQESESGTYYNQSQGIYGKAENMETGSVPGMANVTDLIVYPNPAQSELFIDYKLPGLDDLYITVTDITGKERIAKYFPDTQRGIATLSLQELNPGVYIVSVNDSHRRIIVQ